MALQINSLTLMLMRQAVLRALERSRLAQAEDEIEALQETIKLLEHLYDRVRTTAHRLPNPQRLDS